MKIYYVINGRLPTEKANGYQISQMCQAFMENNVSVTLLRPRRKLLADHEKYENNLKDFYNLREELDVKTIWSIDFQNILHRIHPFFDRLQFISNLCHSFSYSIGLIFFFFLKEKSKSDFLYLRDINILSGIYYFLGKEIKENIIFELHYLPEANIKRQRYSRILKKAKAIIAITNKMKQDLIKLDLSENKIWVEHDGVDLQSFKSDLSPVECRKKMGYPENVFIVGYVGNFHTNGREKGVDDLIRAAAIVLKDRPETQFYFVGGPLDRIPKYKQLVRDLSLSDSSFQFFDRVPVKQVPTVMRAFDVLVIPLPWNPYFAFYMSPMKLFEYMASGRCIVATNVESLCEILENEKNSLLAKHSNTADLAEKILASMDSPELREKLAAQAFKDVAFHTWLRRAERIIQFIKLPPDQRNSA